MPNIDGLPIDLGVPPMNGTPLMYSVLKGLENGYLEWHGVGGYNVGLG